MRSRREQPARAVARHLEVAIAVYQNSVKQQSLADPDGSRRQPISAKGRTGVAANSPVVGPGSPPTESRGVTMSGS